MTLRGRIILVITFATMSVAIAAIIISSFRIRGIGDEDLLDKSRAILTRLEEVRGFIASQGGLDDVIANTVTNYPDGNLPKEQKIKVLKQVPIFASMKVGSARQEEDHYKFRIIAYEPRNKDNTPTVTEKSILDKFAADPKLTEWVEEDSKSFAVYRPVRLSEAQGCLRCHGDPATSPWKNGKDILGYPMENWKDNHLHGAFAIITSKETVAAASNRATIDIFIWATFIGIIFLVISYFALRKSIDELGRVVQALRGAGDQVSTTSREISEASRRLSNSAMGAAASIEETTASTEEISSMVKLNADHAIQAQKLSLSAQDKANLGKVEAEKLISSMTEIAESSKKISEIITVIDDIAFQTNLLALNASVEAARAGEHGKGFAVVADAVRSLAQKSATSAKEISELIQDSVDKVQTGYATAQASGQALVEIVQEVEKVAHLNTEISGASTEQSQGIMQINKGINELDKVTQENAAAAEETSAVSEELTKQSEEMHTLVGRLSRVIYGDKAS